MNDEQKAEFDLLSEEDKRKYLRIREENPSLTHDEIIFKIEVIDHLSCASSVSVSSIYKRKTPSAVEEAPSWQDVVMKILSKK